MRGKAFEGGLYAHMKRRAELLAGLVRIGASGEQRRQRFGVAVLSSRHERCHSLLRGEVDIGTRTSEGGGDLAAVGKRRSNMKGGEAQRDRLIEERTRFDECTHHINVARLHSHNEWRRAKRLGLLGSPLRAVARARHRRAANLHLLVRQGLALLLLFAGH